VDKFKGQSWLQNNPQITSCITNFSVISGLPGKMLPITQAADSLFKKSKQSKAKSLLPH